MEDHLGNKHAYKQKQCILTLNSTFVETSVELPESKSMRVENKMFYFDIGQNNRGTYMRISEVCRINMLFYTPSLLFLILVHRNW